MCDVDLPDSGCFEELLSRGDGEEEQKIIHFLNVVTGEEAPSALFFFKNIREEEVEVTIPVGTFSCQHNVSIAIHYVQFVTTFACLRSEVQKSNISLCSLINKKS